MPRKLKRENVRAQNSKYYDASKFILFQCYKWKKVLKLIEQMTTIFLHTFKMKRLASVQPHYTTLSCAILCALQE